MVGGALALQGRIIPVGVLVNISPPIVRQFQRFRKDDGAPVVDHHKGRNLTRDAPAFIIVPDIVGEYGFDIELVKAACSKTISAIQKPSFEYTDSILANWRKKDVHTLKDVEVLDANFAKAKKASATGSSQGTNAANCSSKPKSNNSSSKNKFNNFNQRNRNHTS